MDVLQYLVKRLVVVTALCGTLQPLFATAAAGGNTPYFEIPAPFVVNLADEGSLSFLQVNAQLKVARADLKMTLHAHLPAIQHTMMMLLSDQTLKDINSVQGKQALREAALRELQTVMQAQIGEPAIEEVYFTGFIVQ